MRRKYYNKRYDKKTFDRIEGEANTLKEEYKYDIIGKLADLRGDLFSGRELDLDYDLSDDFTFFEGDSIFGQDGEIIVSGVSDVKKLKKGFMYIKDKELGYVTFEGRNYSNFLLIPPNYIQNIIEYNHGILVTNKWLIKDQVQHYLVFSTGEVKFGYNFSTTYPHQGEGVISYTLNKKGTGTRFFLDKDGKTIKD